MEEIDLGYNPKGSWRDFNPFARVYVYPKNSIPYVVKGGKNECEAYVKKQGRWALLHVVIYKHRIGRLVLGFSIPSDTASINLYLMRHMFASLRKDGMYSKHWELTAYDPQNGKLILTKRFRRPPRGWPKCLNKYLKRG